MTAHESGGLRELVSRLDMMLQETTATLMELEGYASASIHGGDTDPEQHFRTEVFAAQLTDLALVTAMALDAAGLALSRDSFLASWREFSGKLEDTRWYPEVDALHSAPMSHLNTTIAAIRAYVLGAESPNVAARREMLEAMLESTATLVHKRGVAPEREFDVQQVMGDYLSAAFVDYVPDPKIHGHLKSFKPDGGIRGLSAAVEFKYVASIDDLRVALSGLLEDSAGYRGSKDWTEFYSVIYMTDPFEAGPRFRADLLRAGAGHWKTFLVNQGSAQGRARTARISRATGASKKRREKA